MEEKVADTLLEEKRVIVIGGERYEMTPPSIATLVLASKYIKDLPSKELDEENLMKEMIHYAENLLPIGYAMSAMILGVEKFNELESRKFYLPFNSNREKQGYVLAEKINRSDVKEVLNSFIEVLASMNLTDFFQLTTFLIELNLTSPTKTVVEKTIASGQ